MSIRGSIDRISPEGVAGWAYSPDSRGPLVVQAILGGRIVGEVAADFHRPDLAAAGLGDGNCGFELTFYEPVDPTLLPLISVQPRDGNVELPRTNVTGFPEFFRAVYSRFPKAGRSRSVFGGLWTDRTDATRVLVGRVATGATPPDLEPLLQDFIERGYAVLPSAVAPVGLAAGDAALVESLATDTTIEPQIDPAAARLLEALPGILFRDVPLRILRGILDDNPVACRTVICRGSDAAFKQPSTAERLPSPAECVAALVVAGPDQVELDIVRDSHTLPEFTADGRSRWVSSDTSAAISIAIENGASIETVSVGPLDLAVIGPGTLYRARTPETSAAVLSWITPSRQSPTRILQRNAKQFRVRHFSGAALIA